MISPLRVSVTSKDVNWSRFKALSKTMDKARVDVGLPTRGKFKRNGKTKVRTYNELIMIALYNEFGSVFRSLPERALFRTTFDQNRKNVQRMLNAGIRDIYYGKTTMPKVLDDIGEFLVQQIRDNIMRKMPPHNAASTVKSKGFDHSLLLTGLLYDNIQFKRYKTFARSIKYTG